MKNSPRILAIGNAMVDLIATVPDTMLSINGLEKGRMMLVDADESGRRHSLVDAHEVVRASGGSTGNTAAVIAALGGKTTFIGKVGDDHLGNFYAAEIKERGITFDHSARAAVATANCLAMVTPDGERTMSTYLGACQLLSGEDVERAQDAFESADLVFIEGYLFDAPLSKAAAHQAAEMAFAGSSKIALTLSDSNCVTRNRTAFTDLVQSGKIDVLIGNETEILEFLQVEYSDGVYAHGPHICREHGIEIVMTMGSHGAALITHEGYFHQKCSPISRIVDLIGAGDAFAGGYLYGFAAGLEPYERLKLGNDCAAVVVQSKGARPGQPLVGLIPEPELA